MLTVLVATHNGAQTLPQVLASFEALQKPRGGWKLVVVDNASTDETKQILDSFRQRLPLTYLFEPTLGKSSALNTGFGAVEGDLVMMADDDVLPCPEWLVSMREAADARPEFAFFGGSIAPHWEAPPEPWILSWATSILGITDPGWESGPTASTKIYGANMAVRTAILKAGYRFDTSFGPIGRRYKMGEDTDFLQRIGFAGFKAWHCKEARVAHIIRKEQMNREWILRRAYPSGRVSYWREFRLAPESPAMLFGMPRYMVRELAEQTLRAARFLLLGNAELAFREKWKLRYLWGRAREAGDVHKRRLKGNPFSVTGLF